MTSNSETPQFGDLMRGKWASPDNPQRDGFFVRIIRRDFVRMNPGVWYELTDKRGSFWQYRAVDCELIRTADSEPSATGHYPKEPKP